MQIFIPCIEYSWMELTFPIATLIVLCCVLVARKLFICQNELQLDRRLFIK